jgi:hypothetical protein
MSTPGLGRVKTLPQGISWTRPRVLDEGRPYAQFMIHSSELMPGGSPTFRGTDDIQKLYDDLEALFDSVEDRFVGTTLADFAAEQPRPDTEPRRCLTTFAVDGLRSPLRSPTPSGHMPDWGVFHKSLHAHCCHLVLTR